MNTLTLWNASQKKHVSKGWIWCSQSQPALGAGKLSQFVFSYNLVLHHFFVLISTEVVSFLLLVGIVFFFWFVYSGLVFYPSCPLLHQNWSLWHAVAKPTGILSILGAWVIPGGLDSNDVALIPEPGIFVECAPSTGSL